jgi:hypothetical protein
VRIERAIAASGHPARGVRRRAPVDYSSPTSAAPGSARATARRELVRRAPWPTPPPRAAYQLPEVTRALRGLRRAARAPGSTTTASSRRCSTRCAGARPRARGTDAPGTRRAGGRAAVRRRASARRSTRSPPSTAARAPPTAARSPRARELAEPLFTALAALGDGGRRLGRPRRGRASAGGAGWRAALVRASPAADACGRRCSPALADPRGGAGAVAPRCCAAAAGGGGDRRHRLRPGRHPAHRRAARIEGGARRGAAVHPG